MASTSGENADGRPSRTARSHNYASSLPPAALRYLMIRSVAEVLITGILACGLIILLVPPSWSAPCLLAMVVLIAAGLIIDVPIVSRLTIRHTSYEVDKDAVRIKRGFVVSKDTVLSTAQILNVSVIEGPLLRQGGLAKVRFVTLHHVEPLGPVERTVAEEIRRQALSTYMEAPTRGN
ncbi:PH domain-containing protein [Paenarthrobacter nitroguajacolicus]|uniref:PH domain-containing protein n=1 Tax=Paenarthrobacter nitroguajacolicus TaxID=211146 RepID=UPI003AE7AB44